MSREIEFKIVFGIDGKSETYFTKIYTFAEIENGYALDALSDSTLLQEYTRIAKLQYTGLKDINGKKIFEGDVLTTSMYPHIDEGKQNYVSIVEYTDAGFCEVLRCVNRKLPGVWENDGLALERESEWTILGNIYENPELLEKK